VVSLNEKKRLQEKAEETARAEARKKERASRSPSPQTQYEITLKNADQPGLPAPMVAAATQSQTNAPADLDLESEAPEHVRAAKDPASDPTLEETKHVLVDYIGLLKDAADPTVAHRSASARSVSF